MAEPRLRTSLLVRLLAVSAAVSLASIAATAWLAVRTTTRALQQEQGQALTDDARIYDALLGYAATHRDWSGAGPLVRTLATGTGHRIALTDPARTPLAASAPGALPERPSAAVDPLSVDENLVADAADDRIDPRAAGPFRLPAAERTALHAIADQIVECLRAPPSELSVAPDDLIREAAPQDRPQQPQTSVVIRNAVITDQPSGRPVVTTPGSDLSTDTACRRPRLALAEPTTTEARALGQLDKLVNACLDRRQIPAVRVGLDRTWTWAKPESARTGGRRSGIVAGCVAGARREQLTGHVAPAALLFVMAPGAAAERSAFDLSPGNRARIFGVTGLVLLVTIGVTALVGVRLVRPLHALTAAAGRMRDGDPDARVRVTGRDEIARLGAAFNDMSERRRQVEGLRRAMVGDIAHEMRTPVTNIRGWLEAADEGVVPLDRELMSSLLEEALLLQHVIDDLQDLSAADAGELRLHPESFDVPDLLAQVASAHRASAERAGVTLAVAAGPLPELIADPIRLRQAVGNLVTNAIRHTPPGGRVTLTARDADAEVVIDVTDTGCGMTTEQVPLVFERFWRAEKSRSRQTGGSGLGLSIVRKLAEAHGGTASAASQLGAGSTFTLRLPR